MGLVSSVAASVRKRFFDSFSVRSNTTGSLGTASDGSSWDARNGTIQVSSGAATATSTPTEGASGTTYPMATVTMPTQNNTITLRDTNEGSAVAIWVQSSSDWWLVSVEGTQNTITNYASAQSYNYAFAQNVTWASNTFWSTSSTSSTTRNQFAGSSTTFASATRTVGSPFAFGRFWSSTAGATFWGWSLTTAFTTATSTFTSLSSFGGSFYSYTQAGTFYTYVAGSTTTYNEFLRIRQSVSSTVSIITSQLVSTVASIKSLFVSISGNQITAKAYSDNNLVTQIGTDLVYTANGATVNTTYGIAVSPSAYNQSAIIGTSIDISRN